MMYLCTATLTWMEESWHSCSRSQRSRMVNLSAATEEELYERMAAFKAKHERLAGQPNPSDGWDPIPDHEEVKVSFGQILKVVEASAHQPERLRSTKAWTEHEHALVQFAERTAQRLAEEADEEARQEREAEQGDMDAYLRVKARLEGTEVTFSPP